MKQKLLLFAVLAFIASAFFACGNDSMKKDSAFVTESMTDSVESQIGGLNYWSAITMDFPTKGNPQLVRSIREWMAEQAESSDSVDFASAADAKSTLSDDSACSAIHSRMLLTSCGLPFVGKSIVMADQ